MKKFHKTSLIALTILLIGEGGLRMAGMVDFPLYGRDQELGYWIQPNQHGRFMNKNEWAFNNKGMPIERDFQPNEAIDVPVIGNSIIMGGNAYDQKDKVAPLMQKALGSGFNVWPVAVGGWSNVNQAVYLQRNPEVVKNSDLFIWEVMYGGFSAAAQWRSEYVFPTKAPASALWYVARRYVLPKFINFEMSELPPTGPANHNNISLIETEIQKLTSASGKKHPGVLFLYPNREQLLAAQAGKEWLPERSEVLSLATKYNLMVIDIAKDPKWTTAKYKEGTHPTVDGNQYIATTLSKALIELNKINNN
jgi:hypothetical protein